MRRWGPSLLSHGQKVSAEAEPSEDTVKEESHQNDSLSSAAQSLGNWEHVTEACDTTAWSKYLQTTRTNFLFF